jgi:hypothetical protein
MGGNSGPEDGASAAWREVATARARKADFGRFIRNWGLK